MRYARPISSHQPLLRDLLPRRQRQPGDGQRGFALLAVHVPLLMSLLQNSEDKGLTNHDQIADVVKDIEDVVDFFRDLAAREVRVFGEGVSNSTDGTLRVLLNSSFRDLCEYLDAMKEVLFRLRNKGHVTDDQYSYLVRYFEALRELHRLLYGYLDRVYL